MQSDSTHEIELDKTPLRDPKASSIAHTERNTPAQSVSGVKSKQEKSQRNFQLKSEDLSHQNADSEMSRDKEKIFKKKSEIVEETIGIGSDSREKKKKGRKRTLKVKTRDIKVRRESEKEAESDLTGQRSMDKPLSFGGSNNFQNESDMGIENNFFPTEEDLLETKPDEEDFFKKVQKGLMSLQNDVSALRSKSDVSDMDINPKRQSKRKPKASGKYVIKKKKSRDLRKIMEHSSKPLAAPSRRGHLTCKIATSARRRPSNSKSTWGISSLPKRARKTSSSRTIWI